MQKLFEYGVLLFVFSLPIIESTKNIGFFIMLAGFIGLVFYEKSIKIQKPDMIEYLLLFLLLIYVLSTLLNWPLLKGVKGLKHEIYYLFTFWMLYKSEFNKQFLKMLSIALVSGTIIGLFWGEYNVLYKGVTELKLNSINSISRSGSYITSILFICVGVLIDRSCNFKRNIKVFFLVSLMIISASMFLMGGRGNVISMILTYSILLFFLFNYKKYIQLVVAQFCIALIIIIVLNYSSNSSYVGRFHHLKSLNFSSDISEMTKNDQIRYDYWRIGVAQVQQYPALFGIGPGNYKAINSEKLNFEKPLLKVGQPHHAHNWIITKFVEDGIVGASVFLIFIILIAYRLIKNRVVNGNAGLNWIWVASVSSIFTASISGLFNSAFTHENGMLTIVLMAIGTSYFINNKIPDITNVD